jgi:hypothetical protein
MDFEIFLLSGIFGILLATAIRLDSKYKILLKKNEKNENISCNRH